MIGQKSKFACLKIDDDSSSSSDDEVARKFNIKGGHPKTKKPVPKPGQKVVQGLVVHAQPEKAKKPKKAKKAQVVDKTTGLVVQDADENFEEDQRYKEELKEALRASLKLQQVTYDEARSASKGSSSSKEPTPPSAPAISAADYIGTGNEELLSIIAEKQSALEAAEAAAAKYKWRYKRVIVLLHDTEVNEKVQLASELEKAQAMQKELSAQVSTLSAQLEKARSRIHELEHPKK